jgi:hypothetical protein
LLKKQDVIILAILKKPKNEQSRSPGIFFRAHDDTLMAAAANGRGPTFDVGAFHALFEAYPKLESYRFLVTATMFRPTGIGFW